MASKNDIRRSFGIALVIAILSVLLTFLLNVGHEEDKANQPLRTERTRNPDAQAIDVEISNPSTTTHRGVRTTFHIQERKLPPFPCGAPIVADQIVFTNEHYIAGQDAYSKRISNLKIPANDETTLRVYIVDPQNANWIYYGHLTIEYGDTRAPKRLDYEGHGVLVVGDKSMIP
jgi:hypothetical protein